MAVLQSVEMRQMMEGVVKVKQGNRTLDWLEKCSLYSRWANEEQQKCKLPR